jgi:hypothetical protein
LAWRGGDLLTRDCPRLFDQDDLNARPRQGKGKRLQIPCVNSPTSTVTQSEHRSRVDMSRVTVQSANTHPRLHVGCLARFTHGIRLLGHRD